MAYMPKVSVIMPSLNVALYIRECIESVVNQTLREIEIICVDAGSTDGTLEILQEYAKKDPRIKIIISDKKSYGHQMNLGISAATGNYIGIVETDDYIDLAMFQTLYEAASRYKNFPDIVKSAYFKIKTEQGKVKKEKSIHFHQKLPDTPFTIYQYPDLLYLHPSIWSAIYRREFLQKEHICFIEAPGAGWVDNHFFMMTMCLAKSIVWVPQCLYYYRQDVPNASSHLKDCAIPFLRLAEMFDFVEKHGIEDQKILKCLYKRVFVYLRIILDNPNYDRDRIRPLIQNVMKRINPSILNDKEFGEIEHKQYNQYCSDMIYPNDKNEHPKISVIIPVYNAEKYLRECLDSIANQTLRNLEIICVDDGSTDYSRAILQEYKDSDYRIKIFFQENSGSGKARNRGMLSAKGKYIAFMDADDYYLNSSVLQLMVTAAEKNNIQICGGGMCKNEAGKIIPATKRESDFYHKENGIVEYSDFQCDYGYQGYIFERKMLEENNVTFPDYLRFQDPPFFVKAMVIAKRFYALRQDVYCYRCGHQHVAWTDRQVNDLISGLRDVYELAKENNFDLLIQRCLKRVNVEYGNIIYTALKRQGNQKMLYRLIEFNIRANDFLQGEKMFFPLERTLNYFYQSSEGIVNTRTLDENNNLKAEIKNIHLSKSYKIGRIITWLPRKIRGGIHCYRDHGLNYTIYRVKVHLHLLRG